MPDNKEATRADISREAIRGADTREDRGRDLPVAGAIRAAQDLTRAADTREDRGRDLPVAEAIRAAQDRTADIRAVRDLIRAADTREDRGRDLPVAEVIRAAPDRITDIRAVRNRRGAAVSSNRPPLRINTCRMAAVFRKTMIWAAGYRTAAGRMTTMTIFPSDT